MRYPREPIWALSLIAIAGLAPGNTMPDCGAIPPPWAARPAVECPLDAQTPPVPTGGNRAEFETLISLDAYGDVFALYRDGEEGLTDQEATKVYFGDYQNDTVVEYLVDAGLWYTQRNLPISYGMAWLASDLDLDGQMELVLQRGDPGMGGNGYLDIVSAPDWTLRCHVVLPGMKVYFYPRTVEIDGDPYPEVYFTPCSLGGTAEARIVQFDPSTGDFVCTDIVSAPVGTSGPAAAGDFDGDGFTEIMVGYGTDYALFEYVTELQYRGPVGVPYGGNWASEGRPKPSGALYPILGHSSGANGYIYQFLRATGDNTFEVEDIIQRVTGYHGLHPCFTIDSDLDGLDEVAVNLYPYSTLFEWDEEAEEFVETWAWDQLAFGTLTYWGESDFDWDTLSEWAMVSHTGLFRAFEDASVDPSWVPEPRAIRSGWAILLARPGELLSPVLGNATVRILSPEGRVAGGRPLAAVQSPGIYWLAPWGERSIRATRLVVLP